MCGLLWIFWHLELGYLREAAYDASQSNSICWFRVRDSSSKMRLNVSSGIGACIHNLHRSPVPAQSLVWVSRNSQVCTGRLGLKTRSFCQERALAPVAAVPTAVPAGQDVASLKRRLLMNQLCDVLRLTWVSLS